MENNETNVTQEESKFKFPSERVELPSKGLLYPKTSPLYEGYIEMKYMTAREEDILTNSNYIKQGIVIDKLLQSLILTKCDYDELLVGDRKIESVFAPTPIRQIEGSMNACSNWVIPQLHRDESKDALAQHIPVEVETAVSDLPLYEKVDILDGELVGNCYYIFDMINVAMTYEGRYKQLVQLSPYTCENFQIVYAAINKTAKHKLFTHLKDMGAEGVVFKHMDYSLSELKNIELDPEDIKNHINNYHILHPE